MADEHGIAIAELRAECRTLHEAVDRLEKLVFFGNGRIPITQSVAQLEEQVLALKKNCAASHPPTGGKGDGSRKLRTSFWTAVVVAIISVLGTIAVAYLTGAGPK